MSRPKNWDTMTDEERALVRKKECIRREKWRNANRERVREITNAQVKRWRKANPEKWRKWRKSWMIKKYGSEAAYRKQWRQNNPEKAKQIDKRKRLRQRVRYKKNPEAKQRELLRRKQNTAKYQYSNQTNQRNITDAYLANTIMKLPTKLVRELAPELLRAKRAQIILHREIKKRAKTQP